MKSLEELRALRESAQAKLGIRNDDAATMKVVVAMGTCGIAAGAREVLKAFSEEIEKSGLKNVALMQSDCIGDCAEEPAVRVTVGDGETVTYVKMTAEKAARVVKEHLVNGKAVAEFTTAK